MDNAAKGNVKSIEFSKEVESLSINFEFSIFLVVMIENAL